MAIFRSAVLSIIFLTSIVFFASDGLDCFVGTYRILVEHNCTSCLAQVVASSDKFNLPENLCSHDECGKGENPEAGECHSINYGKFRRQVQRCCCNVSRCNDFVFCNTGLVEVFQSNIVSRAIAKDALRCKSCGFQALNTSNTFIDSCISKFGREMLGGKQNAIQIQLEGANDRRVFDHALNVPKSDSQRLRGY